MPDDARTPVIDKSRLPSRHVTIGPERAPQRLVGARDRLVAVPRRTSVRVIKLVLRRRGLQPAANERVVLAQGVALPQHRGAQVCRRRRGRTLPQPGRNRCSDPSVVAATHR